jgi:hypothetical protein
MAITREGVGPLVGIAGTAIHELARTAAGPSVSVISPPGSGPAVFAVAAPITGPNGQFMGLVLIKSDRTTARSTWQILDQGDDSTL